jgi:DNA-binding NtrC family response regulator
MRERGESGEVVDVLIVDDEDVVRQAMRKVLEQAGYRVAAAADGAAALAHPAARTCRLVLCDLVLPDGSGIEVLRSLVRRRPGLPVVLVTGYATREQEDEARAAGAADFLAKPFEVSELLRVVSRVLDPCGAAAKEDGS